jgi:F-type H+-transporting ATPase subunit a
MHLLGELIRPLSLSLRLFGNILGEDSLIAAFAGLGILAVSVLKIPVGVPLQVPFMLLAMLTGTIQALVFALLSTIYISLVLPQEEH